MNTKLTEPTEQKLTEELTWCNERPVASIPSNPSINQTAICLLGTAPWRIGLYISMNDGEGLCNALEFLF
jgi:hypothetical protein